jgi:sphingomyelin phosphodiesterase 2
MYSSNSHANPQMGDFNSIPTTLPMTILRDHACLTDVWGQSHESSLHPRSIPSPQQALTDYGVTADSPLNSYSAGKPLDAVARRQQGKRLDYILFRHPSRRQSDTTRHILTTTESNIVMTRKVPGYDFSFSDHFGVEASLRISEEDASDPHRDVESGTVSTTLPFSESCLSDIALNTTLQALTARYRTSRSQSHLQLITFMTCVGLLFAVIISSAWLPRAWINPIFILFTVFVSWLATTMFYSGFIFGNWEVNALTNVIEELELLKQRGPGARRNHSA